MKRTRAQVIVVLLLAWVGLRWFAGWSSTGEIVADGVGISLIIEVLSAALAVWAAVLVWRGSPRAPVVVLAWSLLIVARLLYPPTPTESVSLGLQFAVLALAGLFLVAVNLAVRRSVTPGSAEP